MRDLAPLERDVLEKILTVSVPGVEKLRAQLRSARVSGAWAPEGSASFDIWVDPELAASSLRSPLFPAGVEVWSRDHQYKGELLLWLDKGRLSSLEYAWMTDEMPEELPPTDQLKVSVLS